LNLLEAGANDDPQLLHDVARGLVRLGTVQGHHMQSNLGDLEASRATLQRAQRLLEDLHLRFPDDVEIKRDLATALERESGATNAPTQASLDRRQRIWRLRREVMQAQPRHPDIVAEAIESLLHVAFAARNLGRHPLQYERLEQAVRVAEDALAEHPDHPPLLFAACEAHHWSGHLLFLQERPGAIDHLQRAETLGTRLLEVEPTHVPGQLRLCMTLNSVGQILASQGDAGSLRRVEEAKGLASSIVKQNPRNQQAHRFWSILHGYYGEALVALADRPDTSAEQRLDYIRRAIEAYHEYAATVQERIQRGWLNPWESHYPEGIAKVIATLEERALELERAQNPRQE
jgi:tetratricopeptide (TPR) repeat protein